MKKLTSLIFLVTATSLYAQVQVYTSLEEALKNPAQVEHLNLSGQGLTELPKEFMLFTNLVSLDLSNNKLQSIRLDRLDKLQQVNLSGNQLNSLPSFLVMAGTEHNLVIENNPGFVVKRPSGATTKIDVEGYEGTMILPSGATMSVQSDALGEFVRIMRDGEKSKYWLEIRKRGGTTDEQIIQAIEQDPNNRLDYFVNRHQTYSAADTLPDHIFYTYTSQGKVGISNTNMVVFYHKYIITAGSSNKIRYEDDVWDLLLRALTYLPEENGVVIRIDRISYQLTSPSELAGRCVPFSPSYPNATLPELPVSKEVIYTLQPGETVAFTDEYQLGIDMEADQYYIYLKKGGKYYVKTARTTFGPYDKLPNASPEQRAPVDFAKEFKCIKGGQAYFISSGKEYGPFPQETRARYYSDAQQVVFSLDEEGRIYHTISGFKYGPFKAFTRPSYYNNKWYFCEYDYSKDQLSITVDGKKILDSAYSEKNCIVRGNIMIFDFEKDGQRYIQAGEQVYGPLGQVTFMNTTNGNYYFGYRNAKGGFVNVNGKVFGPFDYEYPEWTLSSGYFVARQGDNYYICIGDKQYGPFGVIAHDRNDVCLKNYGEAWMVEYVLNGDEYLVYNNQTFGPFRKVSLLKNASGLSAENKLPTAVVQALTGEYYCYVNDKKFGPFENEPRVAWSPENKTEMFIVAEKDKNGNPRTYVLSGDKKTGPFKTGGPRCSGNVNTASFCNLPVVAESEEGEWFVLEANATYGPYEEVKFADDFDEPWNYYCKKDGKWYYSKNSELIGPLAVQESMKELYESNGHIFDSYSKDDNWIGSVNGHVFGASYELYASNGRNYVADSRGARFVINNKEYNDPNNLAYSYHEETKTFYWLTLEGKNIVRNYVKL